MGMWTTLRQGVIHLKIKSESNAYCSNVSSKKNSLTLILIKF